MKNPGNTNGRDLLLNDNHAGKWTEHSCIHVLPYREMTNRGRKRRKELTCEPEVLLLETGVIHSTIVLKKGQAIFSQGDITDAVFYVQRGKVKLAVTSKSGKEATIAFFEAGSFLGEESIIGAQPNAWRQRQLSPKRQFSGLRERR
jgi:hypothetical protein